MFVAGIDGCRAGWISFHVELPTKTTSIEIIELSGLLRGRPKGLAAMAVDIPIGLLDGPRACDRAARRLLGHPRGSSVFSPPCRSAIQSGTYEDACKANHLRTGKKISRQAWGIAAKIKEVDEAMTPGVQNWTFEVHPEISFWAMNGRKPLRHGKKSPEGRAERLALLRECFPNIDRHIVPPRHRGVGIDDVLDAAAAAWTALRHTQGLAEHVCASEVDSVGLAATIWY